MAKGIIYIMTTAVPGLIKIGKPKHQPLVIVSEPQNQVNYNETQENTEVRHD